MIQNKVLDYLQEHGENIASDIQIENITTRSIQAGLSKLFSLNKVARRQVVRHSARPVWAYRLINTGVGEPEYSYILRNLPR